MGPIVTAVTCDRGMKDCEVETASLDKTFAVLTKQRRHTKGGSRMVRYWAEKISPRRGTILGRGGMMQPPLPETIEMVGSWRSAESK